MNYMKNNTVFFTIQLKLFGKVIDVNVCMHDDKKTMVKRVCQDNDIPEKFHDLILEKIMNSLLKLLSSPNSAPASLLQKVKKFLNKQCQQKEVQDSPVILLKSPDFTTPQKFQIRRQYYQQDQLLKKSNHQHQLIGIEQKCSSKRFDTFLLHNQENCKPLQHNTQGYEQNKKQRYKRIPFNNQTLSQLQFQNPLKMREGISNNLSKTYRDVLTSCLHKDIKKIDKKYTRDVLNDSNNNEDYRNLNIKSQRNYNSNHNLFLFPSQQIQLSFKNKIEKENQSSRGIIQYDFNNDRNLNYQNHTYNIINKDFSKRNSKNQYKSIYQNNNCHLFDEPSKFKFDTIATTNTNNKTKNLLYNEKYQQTQTNNFYLHQSKSRFVDINAENVNYTQSKNDNQEEMKRIPNQINNNTINEKRSIGKIHKVRGLPRPQNSQAQLRDITQNQGIKLISKTGIRLQQQSQEFNNAQKKKPENITKDLLLMGGDDRIYEREVKNKLNVMKNLHNHKITNRSKSLYSLTRKYNYLQVN